MGYTFLGVISSKTMLKFALDIPFSKYSTIYVVALAMPKPEGAFVGFGNAKAKSSFLPNLAIPTANGLDYRYKGGNCLAITNAKVALAMPQQALFEDGFGNAKAKILPTGYKRRRSPPVLHFSFGLSSETDLC